MEHQSIFKIYLHKIATLIASNRKFYKILGGFSCYKCRSGIYGSEGSQQQFFKSLSWIAVRVSNSNCNQWCSCFKENQQNHLVFNQSKIITFLKFKCSICNFPPIKDVWDNLFSTFKCMNKNVELVSHIISIFIKSMKNCMDTTSFKYNSVFNIQLVLNYISSFTI
ncbi:hypothetical protein ACTFIW_000780 [Dictyostelium discoideum]